MNVQLNSLHWIISVSKTYKWEKFKYDLEIGKDFVRFNMCFTHILIN